MVNYATFEGIYEVPEAARYLLASRMAQETYPVKSSHLIRWIRRGLASTELVAVPGRQLLISFEDLVSMRVIAALRNAGVKFRRIYDAERWLRKQTGKPRPFATELLWTTQSDVFAEFTKHLVAASRDSQLALDLIREFLIPIHGLTFDEDQVATTWEPSDYIMMDPLIQFGAPCIKGTRVPTRTISGMIRAGDSDVRVARSFVVSPEEIEAALEWRTASLRETTLFLLDESLDPSVARALAEVG